MATYRQLEAAQRRADREREQASRLQEVASLKRLEEALTGVHLTNFQAATHPTAPTPEAVDLIAIRTRLEEENGVRALRAELEPFGRPPRADPPRAIDRKAVIGECRKDALQMVPLLRFGQRRQAKAEALTKAEANIAAEEENRRHAAMVEQQRLDQLWNRLQAGEAETSSAAEREARAETERRAAGQHQAQQRLDEQWARLLANDPQAVMGVLEDAFADNGTPATPIACQGAEVTLAVKFGGPELVPERRPDITPSGRPTIKKRTKTDRNKLYFRALASNVLATVKETFAVAPAIAQASILVIREETSTRDAGRLAAVYAGRFDRTGEEDLSAAYAEVEIEHATDALFNKKGRTEEIAPLDLRDEPDLSEALGELAKALSLGPVEPSGKRGRRDG